MICPNCGTNCDDGVKECILCGYLFDDTGVFSEAAGGEVSAAGSSTGSEHAKGDNTVGGDNLNIDMKSPGKSKKKYGIIGGLLAAGAAAGIIIPLIIVNAGKPSLTLEEQLESLQAKAETVGSLEEAEKIYKEAEEIQEKIQESIEASSLAKAQSELASIQADATKESDNNSTSAGTGNVTTGNTQAQNTTTATTVSGTLSQGQQSTTESYVEPVIVQAQPAEILSRYGEITVAGQSDSYTFTAPYDGRYRAEITGMGSRESVDVDFYDSSGNVLESQASCKNGDGVTVKDLVAGSTYEIRVSETAGVTPYTLSVGMQKPALDISYATKAEDSVEYTDQRNLYNFTPQRTGDYRFELSDVSSGVLLDVFAFDDPGNKLGSVEAQSNGGGLTLKNLKAGEEYEIQVRQSKDLGSYSLLVK